MLSFTVRMRFDPKDVDDVAEMLRQLTASSRAEVGCVTYVPHFVEGEVGTVLIYEQYRDVAAAEFHRGTAHFKQYAVGGLYQRMLDRQVENLVAVA